MPHDIRYVKDHTDLVYQVEGENRTQPLIWGDEVHILEGEEATGLMPAPDGGWVYAQSRGHRGWVREDDLQNGSILDIVFVDVGQGDACLISTPGPDRKYIMVDAGQEWNMYAYLCWRFGRAAHFDGFDCAVITHGDADHYGGLSAILEDKRKAFQGKSIFPTIYHNGVVADCGFEDIAGKAYLKQFASTADEIRNMAVQPDVKKNQYVSTLLSAAKKGASLQMLTGDPKAPACLPGFDDPNGLKIEILAPVVQQAGGQPKLPWFPAKGAFGKTKNGNSVVLRLTYGKVKILLTGDLNTLAHEYLLGCCSDAPIAANAAYLSKVGPYWQSDVVKWSHHGSDDFSDVFLKAIAPCVSVVSSGDNEEYSHPRAVTLGAIGKCSRGDRPTIFSTELARSTLSGSNGGDPDESFNRYARGVAVYGAINLRTDGKKLKMIQKNEKKDRWDTVEFTRDGSGTWIPQKKS